MSAPTSAAIRRPLPRPGRIQVERIATRLPRPGSLAVQPAGEQAGGEQAGGGTGAGQIVLADRVVSRIASRAANEVDGVGSAAPRLLGVALKAPGLDRLGQRTDDLQALPTVVAHVDGRRVFVTVTVSVAYPRPLQDTAQQIRQRIHDRLTELTGLEVAQVDVHISALVVPTEPTVRVR